MVHFAKHAFEPTWYPRRRLRRSAVPAPLLDWLLNPASLTARVQGACAGQFQVRLLRQGLVRPMLGEIRELGMGVAERAVVRQVYLCCNDTPWVFARTVIPWRTLTGQQRRLARLGNRSLGSVLFSDPSMRRGEVQVARVRPGQSMYAEAMAGLAAGQDIWGRRSRFLLADKPLLVTEVFLPPVLQYELARREKG